MDPKEHDWRDALASRWDVNEPALIAAGMDSWVAEEMGNLNAALENATDSLYAWQDSGDAAPLPDSDASRAVATLIAAIEAAQAARLALCDLFDPPPAPEPEPEPTPPPEPVRTEAYRLPPNYADRAPLPFCDRCPEDSPAGAAYMVGTIWSDESFTVDGYCCAAHLHPDEPVTTTPPADPPGPCPFCGRPQARIPGLPDYCPESDCPGPAPETPESRYYGKHLAE